MNQNIPHCTYSIILASYPLGLMSDAVHSCKSPQVVMQGVFFVGSLQLIHVFVNIPFIKWLSEKKEFSLLTLEHSETDKYKC